MFWKFIFLIIISRTISSTLFNFYFIVNNLKIYTGYTEKKENLHFIKIKGSDTLDANTLAVKFKSALKLLKSDKVTCYWQK